MFDVFPRVVALAFFLLCGCRASESDSVAKSRPGRTHEAAANARGSVTRPSKGTPDVDNATFAYLLTRYDVDGDLTITAQEYRRRDGQFERWDRDADGRLTKADWGGDDLRVSPQIFELEKRRVLGRCFQADEDIGLLSIDEMAEAFLEHYDGAAGSTPDEELSEEEFRTAAPLRVVVLPGDDSMQMKNYSGDMDPWVLLISLYDHDRDGRIGLLELCSVFEEDGVTELRFDREHADAGEWEGLDYEIGLPVGTQVPDLELAALHGEGTVSLRDFAKQKPVALVFGSYT